MLRRRLPESRQPLQRVRCHAMRFFRAKPTRCSLLTLVALLASLSTAPAFQVPEKHGRFDPLVISDPRLHVSSETMPVDSLAGAAAARVGWKAFNDVNGQSWSVYVDGRSGAPLLVQGPGLPFVAGSGNSLHSAAAVTVDSLAQSVRSFMAQNASLLLADDSELV